MKRGLLILSILTVIPGFVRSAMPVQQTPTVAVSGAFGESLETPNHLRQRLALRSVRAWINEGKETNAATGVLMETPNHKRHRLLLN